MKLLVINGPNINMLSIREVDIYGSVDYAGLVRLIKEHCASRKIGCDFFQSNHEGAIIDCIQAAYGKYDGIIINPAGYSHSSVAIYDALKAVNIKTVEVHISDIDAREEFRKFSYVSLYAEKVIKGKGLYGYLMAVDYFLGEQDDS
ncbi:MAG: type II 3-dehydroquinate dehydratase [Erysipelotrichaceae bacterium]